MVLGLLPPAKEVCEGYVFTGVCLSTGGRACMAGGRTWQGFVRGRVCVWWGHPWWGVCDEGHAWQGACMAGRACMPGGMHGGGRVWQTPRDTVNERAVRILLECILVL